MIKNSEIVNADVYAEHQEFAQQSGKLIDQLPAHADKAARVRSAHDLKDAIDQHLPGPEVQSQARELAATVIRAYQVNVAPAAVPSVSVGAELYQQHCAACHGQTGRGDGPRAAALTPPPINFHDPERQSQRSIYSLYSTISLGIDGTAMTPFSQLSESDRWALAFYVSGYAASAADRRRGAAHRGHGRYD